jgi:hypothetical protein
LGIVAEMLTSDGKRRLLARGFELDAVLGALAENSDRVGEVDPATLEEQLNDELDGILCELGERGEQRRRMCGRERKP